MYYPQFYFFFKKPITFNMFLKYDHIGLRISNKLDAPISFTFLKKTQERGFILFLFKAVT